jgi:hypothetical protein
VTLPLAPDHVAWLRRRWDSLIQPWIETLVARDSMPVLPSYSDYRCGRAPGTYSKKT